MNKVRISEFEISEIGKQIDDKIQDFEHIIFNYSDMKAIAAFAIANTIDMIDDKLDEFIVDYTDKYVDNNICNIDISDNDYGYLIKLSNYEYDNMTYNINDKLISKNRLLRNIFVLKENDKSDILFEAILLGSINLDDIDISTLSKIVGHKIKTKN